MTGFFMPEIGLKRAKIWRVKDSSGFVNYESSFGQWLPSTERPLNIDLDNNWLLVAFYSRKRWYLITATSQKLCNHWRHIFWATVCSLIRVCRAKFVSCTESGGCINAKLYCSVTIVDFIYWIPVAIVITWLFIVAMEKSRVLWILF